MHSSVFFRCVPPTYGDLVPYLVPGVNNALPLEKSLQLSFPRTQGCVIRKVHTKSNACAPKKGVEEVSHLLREHAYLLQASTKPPGVSHVTINHSNSPFSFELQGPQRSIG